MTAASIGAGQAAGYSAYLESRTVVSSRGDYYLSPEGEPIEAPRHLAGARADARASRPRARRAGLGGAACGADGRPRPRKRRVHPHRRRSGCTTISPARAPERARAGCSFARRAVNPGLAGVSLAALRDCPAAAPLGRRSTVGPGPTVRQAACGFVRQRLPDAATRERARPIRASRRRVAGARRTSASPQGRLQA
jgi:hypothetical protein